MRLGRALETLHPCDEILIVDHASRDTTARVAREYGARVIAAEEDAPPGRYLSRARHDWLFCLDPSESLSEALAASLFEWKCSQSSADAIAFSVLLREETDNGWLDLPAPQTRLIPRSWSRWHGHLPAHDPTAPVLKGELLRFLHP